MAVLLRRPPNLSHGLTAYATEMGRPSVLAEVTKLDERPRDPELAVAGITVPQGHGRRDNGRLVWGDEDELGPEFAEAWATSIVPEGG